MKRTLAAVVALSCLLNSCNNNTNKSVYTRSYYKSLGDDKNCKFTQTATHCLVPFCGHKIWTPLNCGSKQCKPDES